MTQVDHIFCLGLNHRTASIELREKVQEPFSDIYTDPDRGQLLIQAPGSPIQELVVIQTCNRFELFFYTENNDPSPFAGLIALLADLTDCTHDELNAALYRFTGRAAIEHLGRITAGLDSQVLGESQILGQVARTAEQAFTARLAGRRLNIVFNRAVRAGKRARHMTAISQNPASISSIAILSAAELLKNLSRRKIGIIGLGQMGQLTLKSLYTRGISGVHLLNRTAARAVRLAAEYDGRPGDLSQIPTLLDTADLIICATSAGEPLLTESMLRQAMVARAGRPLVLIDLAVPRDVAPEVADLPGITLLDVDHLRTGLDSSLKARSDEIPRVEKIIAEEADLCHQELETLQVVPLISNLRQRAETIRLREVARTLRTLGDDVDDQVVDQINHLSRSLINKLLHEPTVRLRSKSGTPESADFSRAFGDLFGLSSQSSPGESDK